MLLHRVLISSVAVPHHKSKLLWSSASASISRSSSSSIRRSSFQPRGTVAAALTFAGSVGATRHASSSSSAAAAVAVASLAITTKRIRMEATSTATTTTRQDHNHQGVVASQAFVLPADIEDLHKAAVQQGLSTYVDPATGFTVFTELSHLQRGHCCGNQCRHCPYGWIHVSRPSSIPPPAKVRQRDPVAIAAYIQSLQQKPLEASTEAQKPTQAQETPVSLLNHDEDTVATAAVAGTEAEADSVLQKSNNSNDNNNNSNKKTGGRHGGTLTTKNVPYTRGGDKGTSQLLTGERRSKADITFDAMGTVDELCSLTGVCYAEYQIEKQQLLSLQQQQEPQQAATTSSGSKISPQDFDEWLLDIMSRLFDIGSHIAKPQRKHQHRHDQSHDEEEDEEEEEVIFRADGIGNGFDAAHIHELEEWIDLLTEELPELTSFILPVGSPAAAQLHLARTVCRRAERVLVPLVVPSSTTTSTNTASTSGVCDPNCLKYLNRLSDFYFTAARWVNFRAGRAEIVYQRPFRGAKQRSRRIVQVPVPDLSSPTAAAPTTTTTITSSDKNNDNSNSSTDKN